MSFIYIASPYSHPDENVRSARYQQVLAYASDCSARGEVVFSPIVHSHPMAVLHGLDGNYDFWRNIDETFISVSEGIRVLKLDGWEQSYGIKKELEYASSIGKVVEYVDP